MCRSSHAASLALVVVIAGGCTTVDQPLPPSPASWSAAVFESCDTVPDVGAAQGVALFEDHVYVYGDAETGIVIELGSDLRPTGRIIRLTIADQDAVPHPTGLAIRDGLDAFVGNTTAGRGTIFCIDWGRALARGSLDAAILNTCIDDLAINGSRPEFVCCHGRWLVLPPIMARLGTKFGSNDPARLASASRTSEPGVLVERYRCGPWVQSLHWIDATHTLVLVQNMTEGKGYRLTFANLDRTHNLRHCPGLELHDRDDELEGFALLENDRGLLVNSSANDNACVVDLFTGDR
jgi:hypothetical protein